MNLLLLFLRFEFGKVGKYFKTRPIPKVITTLLFLAVFVLLGVGIYNFFFSGFRYVYFGIEEEFRVPVLLFIYEVFLLVLAGVIVMSSLVSGVFNLFRDGRNDWVMSAPEYKTYPKLIFIKSLLSSTWPLLVIFLPVILAFNGVYHLGVGSLALMLISVVLLLFVTNATTLSIVVLLGTLYFRISRKVRSIRFHFRGFVIVLLAAIIANLAYVWKAVSNVDLVRMFRAEDADAVVTTATIGQYFSAFPTHPFALEIVSLQNGEWSQAFSAFSMLLLFAVVSTFIWWKLSVLFYPLWQAFQEGNTRVDSVREGASASVRAYRFEGGPMLALFKKELLVSSRNWKSILWFSFLSFIWLVQIGASLILDKNIQRHAPDISATMAILQTLQFVIAAYFISSFTLRFVFPSFSVEKKTAWILGSSPLDFTKVFFGKYLFYVTFFSLFGLLMNYINVSILNVALEEIALSMLLLVSAIIFIVTLGMVLGAVFPNRETDDPEIISTSMPGLFFTALALMYSALCAWALYQTLTQGAMVALLACVFFSLVAVALALYSVKRLKSGLAFED